MRVLPSGYEKLARYVVEKRFSYGGLLVGLYGSTFALRASFGIVLVLLSAYIPLGEAAYGIFIATTPLAELLAVPFVGVANDRYGRRRILLGGLALATISLVGRPFTLALAPHILMNILHGVAAAIILVTSLALLADWADERSRGREMGIFDFVNLFGWLAGFILGLVARDLLPTTVAFLAGGAVALLGLLIAWLTVREPPGSQAKRQTADFADLFKVAANPRVALVVAPWLIVFVFIGSFVTFIERLSGQLGLTGVEAALGLGVLTVALLASQVGYGQLSDRFGRDPFIVLGAWGFFAFLSTTAFLVLRTGTAEGLDTVRFLAELPAFAPFLVLSGIAMLAFAPAALAALADEAQQGPSGVTMSLYSLVVSLGFILGPAITGSVTQFGGVGGLAILLFVEGVGLVLLITLRGIVTQGKKYRPWTIP